MVEDTFSIDNLDGYQFQDLVAKILTKKGYTKVEVSPKSGDFGKDIIMRDSNEEIIIVECKHQSFVGRPIVQKLQGAMSHEKSKNPDKSVQGMIVTSGKFSDEATTYAKEIQEKIDLIDGKELKHICKQLNLLILNGKIQIITNKSFLFFTEHELEINILKNYSKIHGSNKENVKLVTKIEFHPACCIHYSVDCDTYTSVGLVDSYHVKKETLFDGFNGGLFDEKTTAFFSERSEIVEIPENKLKLKKHYEFTVNDIENNLIEYTINVHAHRTYYTGQNNVTYDKICTPKRKDITITKFEPRYLPIISDEIQIKKYNYRQKFYNNNQKNLYILDELTKCKLCENSFYFNNNFNDNNFSVNNLISFKVHSTGLNFI